jgi:hypothetical protein
MVRILHSSIVLQCLNILPGSTGKRRDAREEERRKETPERRGAERRDAREKRGGGEERRREEKNQQAEQARELIARELQTFCLQMEHHTYGCRLNWLLGREEHCTCGLRGPGIDGFKYFSGM